MQASQHTVLITGGGSSIGLALAKSFLKLENQVIICGRNLSKLEQIKEQHPQIHIAECDVTQEEQIRALKKQCDELWGGVSILINNAGIFHYEDIAKCNRSLEDKLLETDININGPIRMVHYFLPDMLKKPKAAIVNVSSGLAFVPLAIGPIYSATKAALHSWTESLRIQLKSTSVRVFELLPPVVDTPMVEDLEGMPKMSPEALSSDFMKQFQKDTLEITPGQSKQLKMMRRIAPNFIRNAINKQTQDFLDKMSD